MLDKFKTFVEELNTTNSNNDKVSIIKKIKDDSDIKKLLFYTYNPFYQFNLTSKNCVKYKSKLPKLVQVGYTLFDLLDGKTEEAGWAECVFAGTCDGGGGNECRVNSMESAEVITGVPDWGRRE